MTSSRVSYCSTDDVLQRMYGDEDYTPASTANPIRAEVLQSVISAVSRSFERETSRQVNGYTPSYDQRLFSGIGSQLLRIDELAALLKLEINTTPGTTATWTDYTSDLTAGQMALKPLRFWPKTEIFRMKTFYVDPYETGNVRVTGLWGCVQPDLGLAAPVSFAGLSAPQIASLQPIDPSTGSAAGWWSTPEDVVGAVAEWTAYLFKSGAATYSDQAGSAQTGQITYGKDMPASVKRVIDAYSSDELKVACITTDGVDLQREKMYSNSTSTGLPNQLSRWSGWQTI